MRVHREQRQTSVYALIVGKHGPKLQKTAGSPPEVLLGQTRLVATNKSMRNLADILTIRSDRPVVDMTRIDGFYDIELKWSNERPAPADDEVPRPALERNLAGGRPLDALPQIGLKAEPRKMPLEFLIIDHAEKVPLAN